MQVFLRAVAVGARGAAAPACAAVTPKPPLRAMSTQVPRAGPPEAAATGVSINGGAHALTSTGICAVVLTFSILLAM